MGVFDFLKKDKSGAADTGMELPPVPKMEGAFPDLHKEDIPPLPESSLPPLPGEMPGSVPAKPTEEKLESPKMDLPPPPGMMPMDEPKRVEPKLPTPPMQEEPTTKIPEQPQAGPMPEFPEIPEDIPAEEDHTEKIEFPEEPEMPAMPETHDLNMLPDSGHDELVPDTIPPLEGIPEVPDFATEPEPVKAEEPEFPEEPAMHHDTGSIEPFTYFPPEEEPIKKVRKPVSGPIYMRTDKIRAVLDEIAQARASFSGEDDLLFRIRDIKNAQDAHYEDFRQTLEDMQRKLLFIDRSLFER